MSRWRKLTHSMIEERAEPDGIEKSPQPRPRKTTELVLSKRSTHHSSCQVSCSASPDTEVLAKPRDSAVVLGKELGLRSQTSTRKGKDVVRGVNSRDNGIEHGTWTREKGPGVSALTFQVVVGEIQYLQGGQLRNLSEEGTCKVRRKANNEREKGRPS